MKLTTVRDVATGQPIEFLRRLVREHLAMIAERERSLRARDLKIDQLTHELARLRRVQFAARSERMDPAQRASFDEAVAADLAAVEDELAALQAPAKPSRRKPRRRAWQPTCRARKWSTSPSTITAATAATHW